MLTQASGNTLLYILVLLVVFSVLGLTMVSLFTTSSTSSATPNDARRALYMAESGTRFAMTKLRKSGFSQSTADELNSTTYTINNGGNFTFNVFGPCLDSASDHSLPSGGGALTLDVKVGDIPGFFTIPTNTSVYNVINFAYPGPFPSDPEGIAGVNVVTGQTQTTLNLTVNDEFDANAGELICFAVQPASDPPYPKTVNEGDSLFVSLEAKDIFPRRNGAININRNEYFYQELIVHPGNVELKKLSGLPASTFPFNATTTDYVILSPQNHMIIPTGQAGDVSHGGDLDAAMNIYNRGVPPPMSRAPDIDAEELVNNLSTVDDSNFIDVDTNAITINVGGGVAGSDFGAGWYDGDKSIGGSTNFCSAGACRFGLGVRAFFIIDYSPQGDGFAFTLVNSVDNDTTSVGGDIELPELLAFAGDSRLVADSPVVPDDFLDNKGQGLLPPKLALEFDVRENSGVRTYCLDSVSLDQNTRNDPNEALLVDLDIEGAIDRDVVQYVYWGSNTSLFVPCRSDGNPLSYDDNRHDPAAAAADNWTFETGDNVESSPVIGVDDKVYFGANDDKLYAIDPVARILEEPFPKIGDEWTVTTGDNVKSSPAISSDGSTIYFGSDDTNFYALGTDQSFQWAFTNPTDKVISSPAISSDGSTIYFGSDDKNLYAVNSDGTLQWKFTDPTDKVISSPAISSDGSTIYVGSDDDNLYAVNSDGTLQWKFTDPSDKVKSSPAIDRTGGIHDGTIYVGSDDNRFYAINPDGTKKWDYDTKEKVESSPAVAADGTIYLGGGKDKFFAFNPNGTLKWEQKIKGKVKSRPTISADGQTVYIGSEKNRLYAFNVADRAAGEDFPSKNEWEFTADGKVKTTAAIGSDGTIYIGSDGGKGEGTLHAIQSFAFPRNERGTLITHSDEMGSGFDTQDEKDNWMNQNDYAVRLEVMRSATANPNGNFEYTLHTWIRRCQNENCPDADITGTFFQDTRIEYAWFPAPNSFMEQTIELSPAEHAKMERFLFGFTGATAAGDTQSVLIKQFQLSFIRPNDPIVTDDSVNYPVP